MSQRESISSRADCDRLTTHKTTTMPIIAFTMRTCDRMLENFKKGVHKRA